MLPSLYRQEICRDVVSDVLYTNFPFSLTMAKSNDLPLGKLAWNLS